MVRSGLRQKSENKDNSMGSTLAVMAMSAFAMGAPSSSAQASIPPQDAAGAVRTYAIPAGSMANALSAFADTNGFHLLYDTGLTRAMKTGGLSGRYSPQQGLGLLLSGTGLSYHFVRNGRTVSIILAQNDTGTQSDAGTVALPTVNVTATQNSQGKKGKNGSQGRDSDPTGTGPGESGGRFTGYNAVNAVAATKTNTPILQTPVSVQVVPRETMDDQQDITIQQALVGNVSSVFQAGGNYGGGLPLFNIRGFDNGSIAGGQIYYNGLQVFGVNPDTANVQSFQVVKGPASVLFGRAEPGGLVWVQTKRPLETPYYSFQEQAGAFGLTRTTVDATGPLTDDKTWLYRFNADFSNTNQFTDFVYNKNLFLSPAITYHPIEQFKLFIEGDYRKLTQVFNASNNIALDGWNVPAPGVPVSRFLGDPAFVDSHPGEIYYRQLYYDWTFDITPNWTLTNRGLYLDQYTIGHFSQPIGAGTSFGLPPTNVMIFNLWEANPDRTLAGNIDLKGKFATGPLQHAALLGTDYYNFDQPINLAVLGANSPILNIYNPTYFPSGFSFSDPNNLQIYNHEASQWKGIYAQDMLSAWNDSVHLLIGGRYNWASVSNATNTPALSYASAIPLTTIQDRAFTPRIGLVYQPLPWLSFYGSYTTGFGQNNGINALNRAILPPQKSSQWEGGAKAEFFNKRLTATVAFYDLFKTNVPELDPTNPLSTLVVGEAESKGAEFDLTGKINDNWSLIANYTHEDVRVVSALPANPSTEIQTENPVVGNWLPSVPANAGNLWVKYGADGDFKGLNLMGGVNVVGRRYGDSANSFTIGGYTLVNAGISYRVPWEGAKITAQINATNLLNRAYYVSALDRWIINSGAPRAILGSLRVEF
jgi:iron complex outermembrane receptor protein